MQQLCIGTLGNLQQPALLPYDVSRPWLVVHDAITLRTAAPLCEGVALQLLRQHAPKQARILFFEATPSATFPQIKRLVAASEQQWGEQFYKVEAVRKRLTELEELTHRRFALLAQAGAADIHAYNATATYAEPIIYLLLSGLGSGLSEPQTLTQLQTLCREGAKVGIVPLLLRNTTEEQAESRSDEVRCATVQQFWNSISTQVMGVDVCKTPQPLNIPPALWQLLQRFGLQLGFGQWVGAWVDNLLARIQQVDDVGDRQDFLNVRIGLSGATPAFFSMGEKSNVSHSLIAGASGTGKTTLLNNLLLGACEQYPPELLQFTLMDFKSGISFHEYAGLAHVTALYAPLKLDFPQALRCLSTFAEEVDARYALFRSTGADKIADYNRIANEPLPHKVLVIDEVQKLFEGRDFSQKDAVKLPLSQIAKEGRAAGMHIILSTQSYYNVDLSADVKGQFNLRVGLRQASIEDCSALMGLGRQNDAMLTLPYFTAIYNAHQGEEKYSRVVTLDDLPKADFKQRLAALKGRYPGEIASGSTAESDVPVVQPTVSTDNTIPAWLLS